MPLDAGRTAEMHEKGFLRWAGTVEGACSKACGSGFFAARSQEKVGWMKHPAPSGTKRDSASGSSTSLMEDRAVRLGRPAGD